MHPAALPHPCPLRLATVNKRKKKGGGAFIMCEACTNIGTVQNMSSH